MYFDYAKRMTGAPHTLAVLLSLPLVLTLWSILLFVLSVVSYAFKPGIPLSPAIWGKWLRFGTLSLVGFLAVVAMLVVTLTRTRNQAPLQSISAPPMRPPPPYVPYPYHHPATVFVPGPATRMNHLAAQPMPVAQRSRSVGSQRNHTSHRRRLNSRSSQVAAETFRPERHSW